MAFQIPWPILGVTKSDISSLGLKEEWRFKPAFTPKECTQSISWWAEMRKGLRGVLKNSGPLNPN